MTSTELSTFKPSGTRFVSRNMRSGREKCMILLLCSHEQSPGLSACIALGKRRVVSDFRVYHGELKGHAVDRERERKCGWDEGEFAT